MPTVSPSEHSSSEAEISNNVCALAFAGICRSGTFAQDDTNHHDVGQAAVSVRDRLEVGDVALWCLGEPVRVQEQIVEV